MYVEIETDAVIYPLTWMSQKPCRPVQSSPVNKTLASSESPENVVPLCVSLPVTFQDQVSLAVFVDLNDLYNSLRSQVHPTV